MSDINVTVTSPVTRVVSVGTSVGNSASVDTVSNRLVQTGDYLLSQIQVSSAGVSSLNLRSGIVTLTGAGNITVNTLGQIITVSGAGATGDYYPSNNPSGYITGIDTSIFALKTETGTFITAAQTG